MGAVMGMAIRKRIGLAAMLTGLTIFPALAQTVPPPPAESSPASQEPAAPPVASAPQAPAGEDINMNAEPRMPLMDKDEEPIIKSLLFTPEEIAAIRSATRSYKKRLGTLGVAPDDEDYLRKLAGAKDDTASARFFTYPQFFLESLVYHSPKDWVVWVNDQKITQDTARANTDIKVQQINESLVTFEWRPVSMDRVMEVWQKTPSEGVTVDAAQGVVVFSLHTNQTFSSYVMRVLEGKVMPVTIDISTVPVVAPTQGVGQTGAVKKGLSGLIDAYKNAGESVGEQKAP
jgi:hypothetical protein